MKKINFWRDPLSPNALIRKFQMISVPQFLVERFGGEAALFGKPLTHLRLGELQALCFFFQKLRLEEPGLHELRGRAVSGA